MTISAPAPSMCETCGHDQRLHVLGLCGAMHCYCRAFTPKPEEKS